MVSDLNRDGFCTVKPSISTHLWNLKNDLLGRSGHLWKVIVCKGGAQVITEVQGTCRGDNAGLILSDPSSNLRRGLGITLLVLILVPKVFLGFFRFRSAAKTNISKCQFDLKLWTSSHSVEVSLIIVIHLSITGSELEHCEGARPCMQA